MRYMLALLLSVSAAHAAEVVVAGPELNRDKIAECTPIYQAYQNLGDEPTNQDIASALGAATTHTLIQFTKADYDTACTDQPTCKGLMTTACTLLGGDLLGDNATIAMDETKTVCKAMCKTPTDAFRMRIKCGA